MNTPQYKIFGKERRKVKKRLSELKYILKDYWHWHQLEKDIMGIGDIYPMSDEKAKKRYDELDTEAKHLSELLAEPFNNQ